MLASLAHYVVNPSSRIVRDSLFDRAVLAVVVAAKERMTLDGVRGELAQLLAGEDLNEDRTRGVGPAREKRPRRNAIRPNRGDRKRD